MTRICSIFAASVAILQPKVVTSFAVRPHSRIFRVRLSSTVEGAKNLDVLDIDSVHAFARECSDNLECSIEDLDQVKNALHAERISNVLNSRSDPAWFEVELEDRILEDDLALQLSFLRDHDSDSYLFADVIDENAANFASPIAAEPPQANHATDSNLLTTLMTQSGEALAIIATLIVISILPDSMRERLAM